jgi:hypothetical protein
VCRTFAVILNTKIGVPAEVGSGVGGGRDSAEIKGVNTMIRSSIICSGLLLAGAMAFAAPAQALTMKECSAKYDAAKAANTLNGMGWNDFRKAQCSAAATTPAAAPAPAAPAPTTTTTAVKPKPTMAPAAGNSSNAVFPTAVSPKYSTESAGKQRMHTCLDQYNANKANNGNGGLKWIQKGGGYYSECNKRLKG